MLHIIVEVGFFGKQPIILYLKVLQALLRGIVTVMFSVLIILVPADWWSVCAISCCDLAFNSTLILQWLVSRSYICNYYITAGRWPILWCLCHGELDHIVCGHETYAVLFYFILPDEVQMGPKSLINNIIRIGPQAHLFVFLFLCSASQ